MLRKKLFYIVLWILFAIGALLYLNKVPGLMGDEASEGENIYELHNAENIVVTGERSYIGPAIDYLRVPFVFVFGYSALALRVVMFIASMITFGLALKVFKIYFGLEIGLISAIVVFFSPIYLSYQRLGWTITLFPFFAIVIIYLINTKLKYKWLLAGLMGGLGLANHIIFLPTLLAIIAGIFLYVTPQFIRSFRSTLTKYSSVWTGLLGFWAGFGMQFVVLALHKEDQGDPNVAVGLFSERIIDFVDLMPLILSGSAFVARYTGFEFSGNAIIGILLLLGIFTVIGAVNHRKSWFWWSIVFGLVAHLFALLYVIDRFSLRYFVVFCLGVWLLAGVGVGNFANLVLRRNQTVLKIFTLGLAGVLLAFWIFIVIMPFLTTGGSLVDFSLGNRTNSAAALVRENELVDCLKNKKDVFTENIHIWNRLQYLSHDESELDILSEEDGGRADYLVHYRWDLDSGKKIDCPIDREGEICPDLTHFCVVSN